MTTETTFIDVETARERILGPIPRVCAEKRFLDAAAGRRLAEPVEAPDDVPRFDNSSRDGYALRWADIEDGQARLEVVETTPAGQASELHLAAGQAVRIMTGAPVPDGADTVVMQEHVERLDDGEIRVPEPPSDGRGAWIRHAGAYLREGEAVLEPGERLGAPEIGLLASFGRSRISVRRAPRVAIVSTGDELVDIDRQPGPGQIVNSNAHLLENLVGSVGGEAIVFPIVPDDRQATRTSFEQAVRAADLVISSGGVSVGTHDVVREIVDELTGGMNFWKVRMKPGKPLAFGTVDGRGAAQTPLIGLPGNPNSCFVGFHQFVGPAIRAAQGVPEADCAPRRRQATLTDEVSSTPHRRQYLAGRLETRDGTSVFVPFDKQASANLALFCGADHFGLVPEGVSQMNAGDPIEVEPLPADGP